MFRNINYYKLLPIIIIFISLYSVFFHYFHVQSFGDQASENIITVEQLSDYAKSGKKQSFRDFVVEKGKDIHGFRSNEENRVKYNVDPHLRGVTWDSLLVKALPYVLHQIIHKLIYFVDLIWNSVGHITDADNTEHFNDYTFSYLGLSIFIFFFTALSIIEFSKQLNLKNIRIFLLIGFLSNIFIMQLFRSGLENHVLLFIPIYFYSISFVIKIFQNNNINYRDFIFYPFIFSLSFFNGYPTTSTILPVFLSITVLSYAFLGLSFRTYFKNLLLIIIGLFISVLFYIPESIFWSLTIGQDIFYHLKIMPDRTITMFNIMFSSGSDGEFIFSDFMNEKKDIFLRFLGNIFLKPNLFHAPHEPGMLLGINFFNIIEKIFFVIGIIIIFIFRQSRLTKLTNISILMCVIIRLFTHDNYQVNKASFDFYALCIYISYFGLYGLYSLLGDKKVNIADFTYSLYNSFRFQKIVFYKSTSNYLSFKIKLVSLVLILLISFAGNLARFNNIFVKEFNESLRELSAIGPLKKFIKNNYKDSIFLLYQEHGFTASTDRILMLHKEYEYEILDNFDKINYEKYKNVYLVTFKSHQVGALRNFILGNAFFNNHGIDRFSYKKTLTPSSGIPSINIFEIKNTEKVNFLGYNEVSSGENEIKENNYYIDNKTHRLSKILLEHYEGPINFFCGKKEYSVKVSGNGYSKYSINFDFFKNNGLYYFENIFQNTDISKKFKLTNLSSRKYSERKSHQINSRHNVFINSADKSFKEIISFNLKEGITNFYLDFPYMFYNDRDKKNKLSVKYYSDKLESYKKNILNISSNGSEHYGTYVNFNGNSDLVSFKSFQSKYNKNTLNFDFEFYNNQYQDTSFLNHKDNHKDTVNIQNPDTDSIWLNFTDKKIFEFVNNCNEPLLLNFANNNNINVKIDIYAEKK